MAEIQPFRGWRYDIAQVGNLSEVTAPPYDVIDAAEQTSLYKQHPCNVIRLILNRDEPGDTNSEDRYARAAGFLKRWQHEGVLVREPEDALYVYHQQYDWEGVQYVRKGFLARLRLEKFGEGSVYPHEQTMPGPKADRLKLTKVCKTNLSAIFSLYPDPQNEAQTLLENAILEQTVLAATDHLGVVHRLWPVSDRAVINSVRESLKEKPVFIADGHHRYETALNYQDELQQAGSLDSLSPANFVMMMFVGMDDPGLAVLPTYRLISGLPQLSTEDVVNLLGEHFEIERMGHGTDAARKTWDRMRQDGGQSVFGFGTTDEQWLLARLVNADPMTELAAGQSDHWRSLGVSVLHKFVLDHLLGGQYPHATQECRYVHLLDEVTSAIQENSCQLACLIAPAGIEHIRQIASQLEKMPPKSTYFYPKLLSGFVFNPLD